MTELEIDVRESSVRKESAFQFFTGKSYDVSVKQIPIGDFLFDKKVVFEWKEPNDMINSIMDGRVFKQSKRMKQYPKSFVIVVGDVFQEIRDRYDSPQNPFYAKYHYKKVKPFTIQNYIGALATLYENGSVIHVENQHQAFTIMDYLARNILERNPELRAVDKPVCKMTDSVSTFLACINGISVKKAVLIRDALGLENLRDLLNVTHKDLVSIKGIGSKTAAVIISEIG